MAMDETRTVLDEVFSAPCPCDTCPLKAKCGAENLACLTFGEYALKMQPGVGHYYMLTPTREIYDYIFCPLDNETVFDQEKGKLVERMPKEKRRLLSAAKSSVLIRGREAA